MVMSISLHIRLRLLISLILLLMGMLIQNLICIIWAVLVLSAFLLLGLILMCLLRQVQIQVSRIGKIIYLLHWVISLPRCLVRKNLFEYISQSQNLIIQGIDNVILHISDQLYAFLGSAL